MSTPRKPDMRDVCIMYADPTKPGVTPRHLSTPFYNLPYSMARVLAMREVKKSSYPKGTFYVLVKNGERPLEYVRKQTEMFHG